MKNGNCKNSIQGITLLTCEHAAERLDLSHWTIRDLIARGLLKSVIIGGRRLIPSSALDDLVSDAMAGRGPLSKHGRGKAVIEWNRKNPTKRSHSPDAADTNSATDEGTAPAA